MNNTATTKTPQEVEQLLKASWKIGSFQFIGTYDPQPDGKRAFFKNLKTIQGHPLLFPEGILHSSVEQPAFAFIYANEKFIAEREYKFKAQINSNSQLLSFNPLFVAYKDVIMADANSLNPQATNNTVSERIQKEKYIKELFIRKGNNPSDAKDLASSLRNFQIELYTQTERFIFELLQNADDFPIQGKTVEVNFTALNENILIYHNGKAFSEGDVKSICSIGDSSKLNDVSATGYKGIGFKSVFTHSKCVYINSGDYSFCFDSDFGDYKSFLRIYKDYENDPYYLGKHQDYIGSSNIPWQLKPIWKENNEFPPEVGCKDDFFKSNVSFCLEFGNENVLEFNQKVFALLEEPRFLLFLRNISKINISTNEPRFSTICREVSDNITVLTDGSKSQQYLTYQCEPINFSDRKESFKNILNIPPKLLELPYLTISFAARINDSKIEAEQESILFTYLPTNDRTYNFPFLVNCDFVTSSNREQILPENRWNEFVFEQIGYEVFNWIKHISKTNDRFLDSVFNIIPTKFKTTIKIQESLIKIQNSFNRGFDKAIDEIAFILDHGNQFQTLKNILVDETGIVNLLGIELFQELSQLSESPINGRLENNEKIKSLINDIKVGKIFGIANLIDLITEGYLNEWLMIPANNIKFLPLVKNQTTADKFKTLKIFLNQDGKLSKAEELYWSVEKNLRYIDWLEPQYLMPEIRQALETNEPFKACFEAFEFKKYVRTHIIHDKVKGAVNAKLDDRNTNLKFYRFLFKNRVNIEDFKIGLKYFKCLGKKNIISSFNNPNIFFPSASIDEITDKGWLPIGTFEILSDEFIEINDNAEDWKSFWKDKFYIKECDSNSIGTIILNRTPANKAAIVAHIADKNHNLNFYRFLFANINTIKMIPKDKDFLKTFPIWSYNETIIGSFDSNNIYFSDPTLLDVYERQIVPKSLYNIISDDFCESTTDATLWQTFWKTHFDVKPYVASSFISDIILDNRVQTDNHQKTDSTHSIKFWSYLFENSKETFDKARLKEFHVLVKHNEGDTARFDKLSHCYLSDEYNDNCIESFVKEFMPTHEVFISPDYGGSECKKWAKFFATCKIKPDASSLILNDLLPIISGRSRETSRNDIRLLFKFQEIIEENAQWQTLRNINVLTQTGIYKNIQECFITDNYTGLSVVNDILPSVYLQHQVSDVYLTDESEREKWLIFWKKFAANIILDDRDKVIEQKLKCLVELQDTEGYRAKHLEHFKDVLELYEFVKDAEEADKKIEKLNTKISAWKLTEKGVETETETVALPTSLFLPSAYNPTFDYEGLGVTDLITIQFVSDSYLAYPNAKEFLKYLGVCESITPNNLKVLTRPNAAHRFWELWSTEWDMNKSKSKDWFQKNITSTLVCIPCGNICKAPSDVYCKEIENYVVDKSRLPSVDLRNMFIDGKSVEDFLEFKKMPSLPDCLAFLKTQTKYHKEPFEKIVGWLKSYNPTDLPNHVSIQDFRQTGKWLNADNNWVNINNLAYFGSYSSEMRRLFNSSLHRIKFPSGTSVQDEQKICTWLAIPTLSESSFNIIPAEENIDLDFIGRLRERLPIIAFDAFFDENWDEQAGNYLSILNEWKFYTCSKITLSYTNVERGITLALSASKVKLFKEQKKLCYVESWNNPKTFTNLVNELLGIFNFRQKSDELEDLIFDPKFDVVEKLIEKGLNVPEDWKRPEPSETNEPQQPKNQETYNSFAEKTVRDLGGLSKEDQIQVNKQTSADALSWLKVNNWNVENAIEGDSMISNVVQDGSTYFIIVRSAKQGILYLHQNHWNNLGLENYKLLVQRGGHLDDFFLYNTQTELLNAPNNSQSVIVKQNTKQPDVLTNMVEGLCDADKATLYFVTSKKGASIFDHLPVLTTQSDQELAIISDENLK